MNRKGDGFEIVLVWGPRPPGALLGMNLECRTAVCRFCVNCLSPFLVGKQAFG